MKQETANLWLWAARPAPELDQRAPLAQLPGPAAAAARLRGTRYASDIERLAESILAHRFPLFASELDTGPEIRWRRDYVHRVETRAVYFRFVPYLDFMRAGDHKLIWELNRHQHLVVLAQAWRLTEREVFLREIAGEIESWWAANPYQRGINWTSALEVAFRALSWTWVYHFAGEALDAAFRRRFLAGIYRHGLHLRHNLSVYFSPNTHLLGEAVALHALGALFPAFPAAAEWRAAGARIVEQELLRQVREDGSHFEQSTYYHVYALDFFLLHYLLGETPPEYRARLMRMADYLSALLGPQRALPFLGDDDGGRLFHPYGARDRFGRATLAACSAALGADAWTYEPEDLNEFAAWFVPQALEARSAAPACAASRRFLQSGLAVMISGETHILVDTGPFGPGTAGHSHSDTLALVVRRGEEEILIDPGTFTYVGDPRLRDAFRGSAAHNTVRIDSQDQTLAAGPFRWTGVPEVDLLEWAPGPEQDYLDALCRYAGFVHRRRVFYRKPDLILILDEIEGPAGEHRIEQFWHAGGAVRRIAESCYSIGRTARLVFPVPLDIECAEGGEYGWRSSCFASRAPSAVVRVSRTAQVPARFAAVLDLAGAADPPLSLIEQPAGTELRLACMSVLFPPRGTPRYLTDTAAPVPR